MWDVQGWVEVGVPEVRQSRDELGDQLEIVECEGRMGSKSAGLAERCIRGKARISPADLGFLLTTLGRSADTRWSLRLAESQRKGSRASSRLSSPTSNSFLPSPSRKQDTASLLFPAARRQAADSVLWYRTLQYSEHRKCLRGQTSALEWYCI
jgi:hypothetical protein